MALATIVYEGVGTGNNAAGATTLTVTNPTTIAENELLFAAVTVRGTTTTVTNANWTEFRSQSDGTNSVTRYFWRRASASEPTSYTFTLGTSQKASGVIVAFSGADVITPIEAQNSQANASSTTITAPTITTLTNGAMLLFVGGTAIGTTAAAPSTWNNAGSDASTGGSANTRTTTGIAYLTKATAGATGSVTATYGAAATNAGGLFALKPLTVTTVSGSYTANAVIRRTYTSTFTADSILKRTYTTTFTADAVLYAAVEQTVTKFASTFLSNVNIVNPTNAYADDSVYATDTPARATTDQIYYGTTPFSTTEIPDGSTINSVTWEIQYKSNTTASTGSTINLTPYYINSSAATQSAGTTSSFGQTLTDALATVTGSYTLNLLRQTVAGGASYGPYLLVQPNRAATNTAITWSIDYVKVTVAYVSPIPVTTSTVTGTFTANAVLEQTFSGSVSADAVIRRTYSVTFAANSVLKATLSSAFTANAVIKATTTVTTTADAVLRRKVTATVTGDALLKRTYTVTFPSDSVLRRTFSGSFTGDSLLRRTYSASVTGDAFLKRTYTSNVTATALLKKTLTSSYTANALLKKTQNDSFTSSAVLRKSVTVTFVADSIVASVPPPAWGAPADGTPIGPTPTFYFTIPDYRSKRVFFHLQLDLANTFDTPNLRNYRSNASQDGWEYWDGTDWVAAPSDGIDSIYRTNQARFTPPTPLGAGTWYRRIRSGV